MSLLTVIYLDCFFFMGMCSEELLKFLDCLIFRARILKNFQSS